MFDGRHCTQRDLELLANETNKIKLLLSQNVENDEKNAELRRFLQFLARFDEQIANDLQSKICQTNGDNNKIIKAIETSVNELKQNVHTDIYEHQ